jgi:hypothetical protein
MVDLRDGLIKGRRRLCAREVEAGPLADETASPVATDEIGATDMVCACRRYPFHVDAVQLLNEACDVTLAAHVDPQRARAVGQHGFEGLLIHRAGMPLRFLLRILSDQGEACEWPLKRWDLWPQNSHRTA